MIHKFPEGFLWGAATSAYQAEGAVLTDGKSVSIGDLSTIKQGLSDNSLAAKHYERYKEDIALMKELGIQSYRFSIAWTRIFPNNMQEVNQKGIDFYHHLIDELLANGIQPAITIYHLDLPLYLQKEYGGWISRNIVRDYEIYCRTIFKEYGEKVKIWFSMNEQNTTVHYLTKIAVGNGEFTDQWEERYTMSHMMFLANATAIKLCRQYCKNAKIGPAFGMVPIYPNTPNPEDVLAAQYCNEIYNQYYLDVYTSGEYPSYILEYFRKHQIQVDIRPEDIELLKQNKPDFLAFNYYMSSVAKMCSLHEEESKGIFNTYADMPVSQKEKVPGYYEQIENPYLEKTQWDWTIDPTGLHILLKEVYFRYHLPVMITENGLGVMEDTLNDEYRIEFMKNHLMQCYQAVCEGVELLGYYHWTLFDVSSCNSGFSKRYGLLRIDRNEKGEGTFDRIKKSSFHWYKETIESNGL